MKQQSVSYSINYVFTCGQRRVRICRNIYDQTNNPDYLVEEGSQRKGVLEGFKNENNCEENRWVISSQKQLVSIESNINDQGHGGIVQQKEENGKNKIKGGCMKNGGQGHNMKKCQCFQCISIFNSQKFHNCTQIQGKDVSSNVPTSLFSQFSVQSLKLITDFYIHKISDVSGVLQSHLLVRVEDIFFDLDESNHDTQADQTIASRTYAFNRRTLNGFLFKKCGFYMQFDQQPKPENQQSSDASTLKSTSYYPNFSDFTLKNDNFTFKFVFVQTDEGFSVDGALISYSPLVEAQEQLSYKINILQNEYQSKNIHQVEFQQSEEVDSYKPSSNNTSITTSDMTNTQQIQNSHANKKALPNNEHKNSNQKLSTNKKCTINKNIIDQESHKLSEEADDDEDTQSSSQTVQINNNSIKQEQERDNKKNTSINKINKASQKISALYQSQTEKIVSKNIKKENSNDEENFESEETSKKSSTKNKKKTHSQKQSLSQYYENEQEELSEQDKHIKVKIDEEDEDNEQHSCISSTEHHKHTSQNDDQTSNTNHNSPVQPKKNVVKNFVKAFRNFVQNWGDETKIMEALGVSTLEELHNFRLEYKKFESNNKFNNTFIKALIINEPFKPVFNYFVNEVAWEWLDKSQVNNKKAHKDVLNDYVKATKNPSRIEEIHSLRTRNRQSISKRIKTQ